jgi:hypothetical protein
VQVLYLVYATIVCIVNEQWAQLVPVAFVCAILIGFPLAILYVMKKLPDGPNEGTPGAG